MRRIAFVVIAVGLLSAALLFVAEQVPEKDDLCAAFDSASESTRWVHRHLPRKDACRAEYWSTFKAKPAVDLFDPQAHAAYRKALEREDCDAAMDLLVAAFMKAYPGAPDIARGRGSQELLESGKRLKVEEFRNHLEWNADFGGWQTRVMPAHYPGMALCNAVQAIKTAQGEIAAQGLDAPRYQDRLDWLAHPSRRRSLPVETRNNAIGNLFELSERYRYVPAFLALLELSQEGKVLRFVPTYQYYLLNYLVEHEGVPADRVADMLDVAAAKLPEAKRRELDRQARQGKYEEPLPIND